MTAVSIYFPGLLGPDVPLEELPESDWLTCTQVPHLCKFFSHGKRQRLPTCSIETRILQGLGVAVDPHQDVPLAWFRNRHLPAPTEQAELWCLDPVFIQIDQEEAVLLANEQLQLDEYEARQLIDDLNMHLAPDQLRIHYLKPHQWLLEGGFSLQTHTLSDVMQQNINLHAPEGKDERRWRRLLNEIQMLLHAHPINQAREQRGEPGVNSVWLWGGTPAGYAHDYERILDIVYCDEEYVHDVAMLCDIRHKPLPIHIDETLLTHDTTLLVYTDQLASIRGRDVFAWFDDLKRFDKQVLSFLMRYVEDGRLDSLSLYSNNISITVTKSLLRKWWKRRIKLSNTLCQLRAEHAA